MAVKATLDELADKSPERAIKKYINIRAQWVGLPVQDKKHYILMRIACMARVYDPQSGAILKAQWDKLNKMDQEFIIRNFNPLKEYAGKTPTYVPAVFVNIYNELPDKSKALDVIVTQALPLVVKIVDQYRNDLSTRNMTFNFNKVAGQVKESLDILNQAKYGIDKAGLIILSRETVHKFTKPE